MLLKQQQQQQQQQHYINAASTLTSYYGIAAMNDKLQTSTSLYLHPGWPHPFRMVSLPTDRRHIVILMGSSSVLSLPPP